MTTLNEAMALATSEVKNGFAIQWLMFNGRLEIQTDSGWRVMWPYDPEPDNHPDCNH